MPFNGVNQLLNSKKSKDFSPNENIGLKYDNFICETNFVHEMVKKIFLYY